MSEEGKRTDDDDAPRTGTSVEWRGGETAGGPAAEEEEEDVPRVANLAETRSAGQKAGARTESDESDPPRG